MPALHEHDVAIVGAGTAGALIAARLAAAGLDVLLLDAGPEIEDRLDLVARMATSRTRTPESPYRDPVADAEAPSPRTSDGEADGHYHQLTWPTPLKSTYQRLVGGSTWHMLGNMPRFLPSDFRMKTLYGVADDWPLSYDDLEPWYCDAERELGVAGDDSEWEDVGGAHRSAGFPMPPIWPAYSDRIVKRALEGHAVEGQQLAIRVTPQARNSIPYQGRPPCAGNSSCVPLCPIGAKYDATVHVRQAVANGAQLLPRAVVTRLHARADGQVDRIEFYSWSPDGKERVSRSARARRVVIAAHAIETPLLLLASGLAAKSPVGKNLMDHLQGYGAGLLPEPVWPFRGPPVTSGIDAYRDGAWRNERAALRISIGNDGWGRLESLETTVKRSIETGATGHELRRLIAARATRMLRLSYSTEMLPEARNAVTLADRDARGNPRPAIWFSLPEYNVRGFEHGQRVFDSMFAALGATEVRHSYPGTNYSGAGHLMGTCRMGVHVASSVTTSDCRVHEHPNLYLAGASLFPTSGTANPTLTLAALAWRLADHISATWTSGR